MKFVTFNIRLDNGLDGINCFVHRSGGILRKIEAEMPDVIGFQECLPNQFDFLRRHLVDYAVVGCGRSAEYADEHCCIAYLKDKYELISLETQWLAPDIHTPGARYPEQSNHPRIVTCAALRPYGTHSPFRVYNTHLDNASDSARARGAQNIVNMIHSDIEKLEMPLVVMGDFNAQPDSEPLRVFLGDASLSLSDHTSGLPYTFHNYGKGPTEKIDYILSRGMTEQSRVKVWDDVDNGIYLSDHYPLEVELDLEK